MMRCLTIAKAAQTAQKEILVLCADEDSARMAREQGFRAEALRTDYRDMESETEAWSRWIKGKDHIILVDSYYVTDAYLEKLHAYGKVFLMDDLQSRGYPVDGVINYNLFADQTVYRDLYRSRNTQYFLGAQFAPLRAQFRNVQYTVREQVQQVLLTTGGGDADNIAGQILSAVYGPEVDFHVLVGRFSPHFSEWQERAVKTANIQIHYDVEDMAGLMSRCDLAITAGGSTVYELAAVGVPFICFAYAKNQEALVDFIGQRNIAGSAGAWHKDRTGCIEKLRDSYSELNTHRGLRQQYSRTERNMTDGNGAARLAEILMGNMVAS